MLAHHVRTLNHSSRPVSNTMAYVSHEQGGHTQPAGEHAGPVASNGPFPQGDVMIIIITRVAAIGFGLLALLLRR